MEGAANASDQPKPEFANVLKLAPEPVFVPPSAPRRLPRKPKRQRPSSFHDAFEDSILFYDAFQYPRNRVLLVGPPPHNLLQYHRSAHYTAQPSGTPVAANFFPSRSTMITELMEVPGGTIEIEIKFGLDTLSVPVGRSLLDEFAGSRLLFSINKDNPLQWIQKWATWHSETQGTDALVMFDNGSTAYSIDELAHTLSQVKGIGTLAVVSLPHSFGPLDHWVRAYHYWPRFLQISATTIALRRFGLRAFGILNCDVDELMWASGTSVYDLAAASNHGALRVPGQWIEATAPLHSPPRDHFDFEYRIKGVRANLSPPKCTLDPSRGWVQSLRVHPYLHRIHGAPFGTRKLTRQAKFWHFKGINTNWKELRARETALDPSLHERDEIWLNAKRGT